MSYSESKSATPAARTKSFVFTMKDKLKAKVAQQSWSKLRIICKQTFNTTLPIGLSFVRINSTSKSVSAAITNMKTNTNTTNTNTTNTNTNTTNTNTTAPHKASAVQKSGSRLVFEEPDEQEESAVALFEKIRPATTFAQLKAQVELEKSKTPPKKTPVSTLSAANNSAANNSAANNSAPLVRNNPFSDTKSAGKNNDQGDKPTANKSAANKNMPNKVINDKINKSGLPNKDIKDTHKPTNKSNEDKKKSVPLNKVMVSTCFQ